ncbi:MAG: hypothetical protein H6917_15320 [Novosphingobium sp.]|nr:hypothetical protein [Novosphingobium sp.]
MAVVQNRTRMIWRGVTLVTLLVIALHALIPIRMTFEPAPGSAFSAFTSDVSVGCGQRAAVERKAVPADPSPPVQVETGALAIDVVDDNCRRFASWPRSIGPPSADTTYRPLNPQAPPAA